MMDRLGICWKPSDFSQYASELWIVSERIGTSAGAYQPVPSPSKLWCLRWASTSWNVHWWKNTTEMLFQGRWQVNPIFTLTHDAELIDLLKSKCWCRPLTILLALIVQSLTSSWFFLEMELYCIQSLSWRYEAIRSFWSFQNNPTI